MAGVNIDTGGSSGKKSVDVTINLVPFIDLLCSLIAFLMMTAVWTQVGKLQVAQGGGESDQQEVKPTLNLVLTLTEQGYLLSAGAEPLTVPKKDGGYDVKALIEKLKTIKNDNPDQKAITVQAEDAVEYQDLVRVVDTCLEVDLPDVSVTAALG